MNATDAEVDGVWIAYHYAPFEGCSSIVPFDSAVKLAMFMAEHDDYLFSCAFVKYGEMLKP